MSETAQAHDHDGADHPGPVKYAVIAVILSGITLLEFGAFYVEPLRAAKGIFVTLLIVASTIKFVLVAMFYMHLKFDHPVFRKILLAGVMLGFLAMLWLLALFSFSHPLLPI